MTIDWKAPGNVAHVSVDQQIDFCEGGNLAVKGGNGIVPLVNALQTHFLVNVKTQDFHPAGHSSFASAHKGKNPFETAETAYGTQVLWPDHCVQGTPGAAFHPGLRLLDQAELILRKGFRPGIDSYSAFYENDRRTPTGLAGYLRERGLRRVVMAGLATDFCVSYSALDARREGFEAVVLEDACRAIDLGGSLAAALSAWAAAGVRRQRVAELAPA
jgi:nicotinamidase/pyrazinamidase